MPRTALARPRRAVGTTAVGLLLCLVVSCGGRTSTDSPSAVNASDVSASTSGASDGSNNGSGGGSDNGGDNGGSGGGGGGHSGGGGGGHSGGGGGGSTDRGVAWAPFGPQDPSYPTPTWPVYNAFASGDCSRLASELPANEVGDYGKLMLAVCQAAVEGQTEKWDTAESLADADSSSLGNDCVAPLVQAAVERALTWHQEHPELSPEVQLQRQAAQTACGAVAASENAGNGDGDGDGDATDSSDSSDSSDGSSTTGSPSGYASPTP